MDKNALLTQHFEEEKVELKAGAVTIRSLSREEALMYAGKKLDAAEAERKLLAKAMVDPEMSEQDVAAWQKASPAGEIQKVFTAVVRLSGMEESSAKEAYKSAGAES